MTIKSAVGNGRYYKGRHASGGSFLFGEKQRDEKEKTEYYSGKV